MTKAKKPQASGPDLDAELVELKKAFNVVAEWHSGAVRKMVKDVAKVLDVKSDDPDDKRDAVTNAFMTAVDTLGAANTPAAQGALDDIGDAVSKSMKRMMPQTLGPRRR